MMFITGTGGERRMAFRLCGTAMMKNLRETVTLFGMFDKE